jgi:thymidylate synthase (FAD)
VKEYQSKISLYDDDIGFVEYVQHMGSDLTVVNSARVSFGKSVNELAPKDEKLIQYLINHRHTSTLEHCQVTFRCKVPLFVRSQHHRHRTFSYNEISFRYTDATDVAEFYCPKSFRTQHKSNRQASNENELINPILNPEDQNHPKFGEWIHPEYASNTIAEHHAYSLDLYNKLIGAGVCREQARGVLPQNLYTEYFFSCNLSNCLKFIDLRTHEGAQWEIQQLAKGVLKIISDLYPVTVQAYKDKKEEF